MRRLAGRRTFFAAPGADVSAPSALRAALALQGIGLRPIPAALRSAQVFAPGEVHRLSRLKKAQIASEAERLAAGSGWLPVMFTQPEAVGRSAIGRRMRTRAVQGIDQNVKLNRALWMLAEEMRRLKG